MRILLQKLFTKPELVFLLLAGVFGVLSVFLMPILSTPDENQHFQVEYAMFSKDKQVPEDLVLSDDHFFSRDQDPAMRIIKENRYSEAFTSPTQASEDGVDINVESYVYGGKTRASVFDIMHLPQALGVLTGRLIHPSIGSMVSFGRLFNLVLFISVMYLIIKKVKYGKWVFLFIACLPMSIQQAASLSYDSTNMLIIFAWVAFIINLYASRGGLTKKHIFGAILLATLLLISKTNNLLLLVLLFALPTKLFIQNRVIQRFSEHKAWRPVVAVGFIALGVLALFVANALVKRFLSGNDFSLQELGGMLLNTFVRGDHLALIDATAVGVIGYFSNFYFHVPVWVVVTTFIVLFILLLSQRLPNISKRFAIISGGLFVGSVLVISIGMYYAWALQPFRLGDSAQVADGIQGRYFTPLLILLFPAFAYLQRYIKITTTSKYFAPALASLYSFTLLLLYTYQTWDFFWS